MQGFLGCLLLNGLKLWCMAGLGYSFDLSVFSRRMALSVNGLFRCFLVV